VRKLTVEMLRDLGYATVEAEGGADALAKLEAHPEVALMLTDVVMPGMNGRQLADEAQRRRPALVVLFTTGYTRDAIVHHGVFDPDVQVVVKPHTLEMLALKVSEVLAGRSAAE
jgi:CheY-like chemotaxis protein